MSAKDHIQNEVIKARQNFSKFYTDLRTEAYSNRDKYSEEDIRCGFFVILYQDVLWPSLVLEEFSQVINEKTSVKEFLMMDDIPRLQFLFSYNQITRMSFLTKFMFDIEDFLKSIMAASGNPMDDGYYVMTEKLLKLLDLYDKQNHGILNAPAQIRNSLHNGGFASYDFEVIIKEKTFKFKRGERIVFASWDNIYLILDELVNLIKIIIKNKKNLICKRYFKWLCQSLGF